MKLELDVVLRHTILYEDISEAVVVINEKQDVLFFNESFKRLISLVSHQQLDPDHQAYQLKDLLRLEGSDQQLFTDTLKNPGLEKVVVKEAEVVLFNHHSALGIFSITPLFDDDHSHIVGFLIGFFDRSQDVEVHRKLQEKIDILNNEAINMSKLMDNLKEYERMANASNDGLTLIDKNYCYKAVNRSYLEMKHKKIEDILHHKISDIWGDFAFNTIIKPLVDRALKGERIQTQNWFSFAGDEQRYIDTTYSPYLNSKNEYSHVVVTSHDITNLKLTEIELSKSVQVAEQALESKSQFLAKMSHEIRTPMNGIISMADDLAEDRLSPSQKEAIETIQGSAESLLKVINDLLDFSKVEAGKMDLEFISFNPRKMVEQVRQLFHNLAINKKLQITSSFDSSIPEKCIGDPSRIKQVLINFLNNAIKFTQEGEIEIQVKHIEGNSASKCSLDFSVRDTGIGMDKKTIDKIFQPFSQADSSTTRLYGGTGLGLAIAKQMADLMKGQVHVQSEKGSGSTFSIILPFEIDHSIHSITSEGPSQNPKTKKTTIFTFGQQNAQLIEIEKQAKGWGARIQNIDMYHEIVPKLLSFAKQNPHEKFHLILSGENGSLKSAALGKQLKSEPILKNLIKTICLYNPQKGDAKIMEKMGYNIFLSHPVSLNILKQCLSLASSDKSPDAIITKYHISDKGDDSVRILVVDDNLTNRKVAGRLLQNIGYLVDFACDGEEAVKAVEPGKYRVVLMDLHMPILDGLEATKAIRKKTGLSMNEQPIIALTADAISGTKEKCEAAEMNDYISKPFRKEDLIKKVGHWAFLKS